MKCASAIFAVVSKSSCVTFVTSDNSLPCSSSTLKEASSWGKVDTAYEQMVYAEATTVIPLIASYAYHKGSWKKRKKRNWNKLFK